jgi:hypothetical protein
MESSLNLATVKVQWWRVVDVAFNNSLLPHYAYIESSLKLATVKVQWWRVVDVAYVFAADIKCINNTNCTIRKFVTGLANNRDCE